VAKYPDSTKTSLEQRLRARARERWPQIASLQIRHRGDFSYVDATLTDDTTLKLCRLRYVGSASQWQFAIYRASHDDYDESVFFTGLPVGSCQDALDTACGLYLNDPTAWTRPPTNLRARPLRRAWRQGAGWPDMSWPRSWRRSSRWCWPVCVASWTLTTDVLAFLVAVMAVALAGGLTTDNPTDRCGRDGPCHR
jgi:hypothetical protein